MDEWKPRWLRAFESESLDRPGVSATGACLCTSFSRDVRTDECRVCGHVSHASRVHCGVMVHA